MAEVNANSLPAKTDLGTNDSAIVVDQTTNAGALVDLDVLADKVLDRLTSKTFTSQVGSSSAQTILAQLSTLNSKITATAITNNSLTMTIPLGDVKATHIIFIGYALYGSIADDCGLYMVSNNPNTRAVTATFIQGPTVQNITYNETFTEAYFTFDRELWHKAIVIKVE